MMERLLLKLMLIILLFLSGSTARGLDFLLHDHDVLRPTPLSSTWAPDGERGEISREKFDFTRKDIERKDKQNTRFL